MDSRNNLSAAIHFRDDLFRRVEFLGLFPRSGAVYVRGRGREVRQITYGNYRVIYRVRPKLGKVQVLMIWHGARREPPLRQ
jgi:plasmid stabilization system protein ParE